MKIVKRKVKKDKIEVLEEITNTKTKSNSKKHIITLSTMMLISVVSIILGYYIERKLNYKNIDVKVNYNVISTKKEYNLSLIMGGDCLIHSAVYSAAYSSGGYNFKNMITNVKEIVSKYDLAYYNQETILGGSTIGLSTYPQFNSPQEVGDAFVDAGFNLVSLANNHSLDTYYYKGGKAQSASQEYWDKYPNVIATGAFVNNEDKEKIVILEKNNITYTLLSYTTSTNGIPVPSGKDYLVNVYSAEKVKSDIEKYRDKVDVIMVAMHWGSEYTHDPTYEERTIAEYLSSLGVNIIIGTHPHVIQPVKYINDTLVVYSLGNLISAQQGIEKLTGLLMSANIKKTVFKGKTTIEITEPTGQLIYTNKSNSYKIIPYTKLNNDILYDYKNYYNKYASIVTSMDNRVKMIGLD